MSRYSKILDLSRPEYPDIPKMPIEDRAAQFSPFAAVVGYEDAVAEESRLTERRIEQSEDEAAKLDMSLARLREEISQSPLIKATYFVPDLKKDGGEYVSKEGRVRRIDEACGLLIFTDRTSIKIADLIGLDFV